MAALGSQSIASSYEQLLHVDADGGGNGTTHVSVKDGDNGTTFGFTIATDALMMTGTNRLEFGDTGTYIHQSADGVLDLVSDTELELNATTIDMNGAVDMSSTLTLADDLNVDSGTFFVDVSENKVGINSSSPDEELEVFGASDVGIKLRALGTSSTAESHVPLISFQSDQGDGVTARASISADRDGGSGTGALIFKTRISDNVQTAMKIDSLGTITAPKQPAFLVHPSADQENFAATSTTINFGTERFDLGSNFASNTFTAPVTGKYQINISIKLNNVDSAANFYQCKLVSSNRVYEGIGMLDPDFGQDAANFFISGSILIDMDANDTASLQIEQSIGTAQTDIDTESYFSGFLVA